MQRNHVLEGRVVAGILYASVLLVMPFASAQLNSGEPQILSTGQRITPLAPQGSSFQALNPGLADNPQYTAGQAVQTALSPDKKRWLSSPAVTTPRPTLRPGLPIRQIRMSTSSSMTSPTRSQCRRRSSWFRIVITVSLSTQQGRSCLLLAASATTCTCMRSWAASGQRNRALRFLLVTWRRRYRPSNLGGLGLEIQPEAAGLAVTADGEKLVVANYENDSISVLTKGQPADGRFPANSICAPARSIRRRPAFPAASSPSGSSIKGDTERPMYRASVTARSMSSTSLCTPTVTARIALPGQPNKMVLNKAQTQLFVAQDNSDSVAVIDTANNTVQAEIYE